MLSDKKPIFALQLVMVSYSDLPDIIECPCDNCSFEDDCPFSEFLIVDCPMQERPRNNSNT